MLSTPLKDNIWDNIWVFIGAELARWFPSAVSKKIAHFLLHSGRGEYTRTGKWCSWYLKQFPNFLLYREKKKSLFIHVYWQAVNSYSVPGLPSDLLWCYSSPSTTYVLIPEARQKINWWKRGWKNRGTVHSAETWFWNLAYQSLPASVPL